MITTPATPKITERVYILANGMNVVTRSTGHVWKKKAKTPGDDSGIDYSKQNEQKQIRKLGMKMNHNCTANDYFITATYSQNDYTDMKKEIKKRTEKENKKRKKETGRRMSKSEAEDFARDAWIDLAMVDIARFVRKIQKYNPDVKYIFIASNIKYYSMHALSWMKPTTHIPDSMKRNARIHIHGILSGDTIVWKGKTPCIGGAPIDQYWGHGHCKTKHLPGTPLSNGNHDFSGLAAYLIKQTRRKANRKSYIISHNFAEPTYTEEQKPLLLREIPIPSGAELISRNYSPMNPANQSVKYVPAPPAASELLSSDTAE